MLTTLIQDNALATAKEVSKQLKKTIHSKRKIKLKLNKVEEKKLEHNPTHLKERNNKACIHEHKHWEYSMPNYLKRQLTKKTKNTSAKNTSTKNTSAIKDLYAVYAKPLNNWGTIGLNKEKGKHSTGTLMSAITFPKQSQSSLKNEIKAIASIQAASSANYSAAGTKEIHTVLLRSEQQQTKRPNYLSDLTKLTDTNTIPIPFPDDCTREIYNEICAVHFGQDFHEDYTDGKSTDLATTLFSLHDGYRIGVVIGSPDFTQEEINQFDEAPWLFSHAILEFPPFTIIPFENGLIHCGSIYYQNKRNKVPGYHCRGHSYQVLPGNQPPENGSKARWYRDGQTGSKQTVKKSRKK